MTNGYHIRETSNRTDKFNLMLFVLSFDIILWLQEVLDSFLAGLIFRRIRLDQIWSNATISGLELINPHFSILNTCGSNGIDKRQELIKLFVPKPDIRVNQEIKISH